MGKLVYDDRNGYDYISDNGVKYDLLEGKSLGGKTTSDIIYIHLGYNEGLFENIIYKHNEISEFVGWFYGASFVIDKEHQDEYIKYIDEMVKEYEEKYPEIVKYFKPEKEYEICFEKYGKYKIKATSEDEAWKKAAYVFEDQIDWYDEFVPTVIEEI